MHAYEIYQKAMGDGTDSPAVTLTLKWMQAVRWKMKKAPCLTSLTRPLHDIRARYCQAGKVSGPLSSLAVPKGLVSSYTSCVDAYLPRALSCALPIGSGDKPAGAKKKKKGDKFKFKNKKKASKATPPRTLSANAFSSEIWTGQDAVVAQHMAKHIPGTVTFD